MKFSKGQKVAVESLIPFSGVVVSADFVTGMYRYQVLHDITGLCVCTSEDLMEATQ